jgi:hypothetical protein
MNLLDGIVEYIDGNLSHLHLGGSGDERHSINGIDRVYLNRHLREQRASYERRGIDVVLCQTRDELAQLIDVDVTYISKNALTRTFEIKWGKIKNA